MRKFDATNDYYRVLGVNECATEAEIDKAYRRQARRRHPDFGGTDLEMTLLNEAHEVLGDAATRKLYDAERRPRSYAIDAPIFNSPPVSKSDILTIPSFAGRTVRLIAGSAASFVAGLIFLMNAEDSNEVSGAHSWLLRAVSLAFFAGGVVLAHSAGNSSSAQSTGAAASFPERLSAAKRGVIWALCFVALVFLMMIAYVRAV